MKKYLVAIALMAFIGACGSGSSENKNAQPAAAAKTAEEPANSLSSNPDYQKGLALIAKSDCLTCHKVNEKVTGPAYRDVANKYENTEANVTLLAGKILKGGAGVWSPIPMTPHPALSEEDAKQMVKYILLLRNK